jgi:small-conductance mechanosensitive channel
VVIRAFNSSSIDMQLFFWVRNIGEWMAVKTDAILAIDIAFKENGIKIPFPQQDLPYSYVVKEEDNNSKNLK